MIKLSNILVLFCFFSIPSYAIDLNTYEGDEYWKKVDSLNWIDGPTTIKHINQGAIYIDQTQSALTGDDARQLMYWINGVQFDIDVFVKNYSGGYTDYRYINEGYVKLDDWKDVNPDKFIKELKSGMKESNKKRF